MKSYNYVLALVACTMNLVGCPDSGSKSCDPDFQPDYETCCCEVVEFVTTEYGGGNCASLTTCHDAGYYYPDAYDEVSRPNYDLPETDWRACYYPNFHEDDTSGLYVNACESSADPLSDVCAEEVVGVWYAGPLTVEADPVLGSGVVCSSTDLELFMSFSGTGDAGHGLGIMSGSGTVVNAGIPSYEEILDTDDGTIIAVAALQSDDRGTIEFYSTTPGCTDALFISVASFYLTDTNSDGEMDTMETDFSRDPAYEGMKTFGCNSFPLHGITFTKLDSSAPEVATVLTGTTAYWEAAASCSTTDVEAYAECEDVGAAAASAGPPPPPPTSTELIERIRPMPEDWPWGGHYSDASYTWAANQWVQAKNGDQSQWLGRARTKLDPLFPPPGSNVPQGATTVFSLLSGAYDTVSGATGFTFLAPWQSQSIDVSLVEMHDRGAHILERLQVDPVRRQAIDTLASEWLAPYHSGLSGGELEWKVSELIRKMPDGTTQPIGLPPVSPPGAPPPPSQ